MKVCGKTYNTRNPAHVIRDAEMVLMFRDGKTLAEIGSKYGVTREYVRQQLSKLGLSRMDGGQALRMLSGIGKEVGRKAEAKARRERRDFEKWGMTPEGIASLSPLKRGDKKHPIRIFEQQRNSAKRRGVGWQLTLSEWWRIWQESGHWEERGRGKGYCMARWADDGPYSAENVYICTCGQNFSDSYITKPWDKRFPHKTRRNPPGFWAAEKRKPKKTHWKFGNMWVVHFPNGSRKYGMSEEAATALAATFNQVRDDTPASADVSSAP